MQCVSRLGRYMGTEARYAQIPYLCGWIRNDEALMDPFTFTQRSSPPLANHPIPLSPISEPLIPGDSRQDREVTGVVCATKSLSSNPR